MTTPHLNSHRPPTPRQTGEGVPRFDRLYPFPDGGLKTVLDVLGGLPAKVRASLDWDVTAEPCQESGELITLLRVRTGSDAVLQAFDAYLAEAAVLAAPRV